MPGESSINCRSTNLHGKVTETKGPLDAECWRGTRPQGSVMCKVARDRANSSSDCHSQVFSFPPASAPERQCCPFLLSPPTLWPPLNLSSCPLRSLLRDKIYKYKSHTHTHRDSDREPTIDEILVESILLTELRQGPQCLSPRVRLKGMAKPSCGPSKSVLITVCRNCQSRLPPQWRQQPEKLPCTDPQQRSANPTSSVVSRLLVVRPHQSSWTLNPCFSVLCSCFIFSSPRSNQPQSRAGCSH